LHERVSNSLYFCTIYYIFCLYGKKEKYKEMNLQFLKDLSTQNGIRKLPCGISYKVLCTGVRIQQFVCSSVS